MSFLTKFKSNTTPSSPAAGASPAKKDPNAEKPTALDKYIAEIQGPIRLDGSDKYFGFENYSSTCYCNSIIQCLYFSEPFRNNVISFPSPLTSNGAPKDDVLLKLDTGSKPLPRSPLAVKPPPGAPGPLAANSPARRPIILPGTPQAQSTKPDEKDSPEWRKKILMQSAPMLDMQLDYADAYGMQESLFTALKDIFEAVISHPTRTGIVSPHKFLEILRKENEMFRSAMHQDAHEFLNLLLNQVVDNVEDYTKQRVTAHGTTFSTVAHRSNAANEPAGWVHDLFEGLLTSETRCLTCENTSQRDEAFMDLSVDLEAHSSVTSCLRKFSEEEMLCERNKFHCDNCGGLQEAEKRMKIKKLPRILALHLKRFKYTEDYNRLQKLFHRVVYPFYLRLFNTTEDAENADRIYELYAVVVHIGGGPYHGHYVSIIKTQDRGWLLFDDELVEPVDKEFVQHFFGGEPKIGVQDAKQLACAYVLFYQETTLEAMQKEQEADAEAAANASTEPASSNVATASPTTPGALWSNGFRNNDMIQTPTIEEADQFANLSHAVTAPALASASTARPPLDTMSTSPFIPAMSTAPKTRKERKLEEKEKKIAAKEAEKQVLQKRKELIESRRAQWKRADDELQAAIEASKQSKNEEDTRAGTDGSTTTTTTGSAAPAANGKDASSSGLGRFRHGSMSVNLGKKPRFFGGASAKEKDAGPGAGAGAAGTNAAAPGSPAIGEDGAAKEEKKNRFSIGRKKTGVF